MKRMNTDAYKRASGTTLRVIVAMVMVLFAGVAPVTALAVDYSIENYEMTVDVASDASANITETLEYHFDSDYNGILSSFDVGDVLGLEDLTLFVDGNTELRRVDEMNREPFTYTLKRDGKLINVQAYAPGDGGTRTFRYTYRLNGLCQRYQDAARLNYKLIGTENQVILHNATIKISLPGEVYDAWAHGAMKTSDILEENGVLIYGPANVQSGRFVEADILFDPASLSDAWIRDEFVLEDVRSQEAKLAEQAQATEVRRAQLLDALRRVIIPALIAFAAACGLSIRKLSHAVGYPARVVPDGDINALKGVQAAVAQWVYAGKIDTDGLTGTLLELVMKGAVEMKKPQSEFDSVYFVRKHREMPGLTKHQQCALEWLFSHDRPLYPDSLNAQDDTKRAQEDAEHWNEYQALVRQGIEATGYLSTKKQNIWILVVLCIVGVLLSVGMFYLSVAWAGILAAGITIVMIDAFCRLRRLSDEGERVYAALHRLAQGGDDCGISRQELPQFMPIIAALGCLDPFFEQQEETWQEGYDSFPYWMYAGWHHDMRGMRNGLNESRQHNQSLIAQDSSSGDSSSGGGGGGGGHGAW